MRDSRPHDPVSASSPSHYVRLARRMSSITSNALGTAVVLVLALGCGRELISWWGLTSKTAEPPEAAASLFSALDATSSCSLEFGNAPFTFLRENFSGDRTAVLARLRQSCAKQLAQGAERFDAVGPAEARLLEQLVRREPVQQRPGMWRMYEDADGFPLVLGVKERNLGGSQQVRPIAPRLAVWGLAVPQGENVWAMYVCRAITQKSGTEASAPLPPSCERTLALSHANNRLIGFRGGEPAEIMRFYDAWAEERGWRLASPWRNIGAVWQASYAPQGEDAPDCVEVQFTQEPRRALHGLTTVTGPNAQ
jgi:hypothetical protein